MTAQPAIADAPAQTQTVPQPRVLIMIPCLNEAESIVTVLGRVNAALPDADIVVIDDGSTDNTAELAWAAGAMVASLPYNLGIGSAMQTGFLYAKENNYDIAVQVDGDGQHNPDEIVELLAVFDSTDADVVIGSRYIEDRGYITPFVRRVGIVILSAVISLVVRQKFTDTTSGFRASNRRAIEHCAVDYPFDYPEPEAVITLTRAGLTLQEIPVTMNPRYGGQSSITPLRSIYYMVKVLMTVFINLLRQPYVVVQGDEHAE